MTKAQCFVQWLFSPLKGRRIPEATLLCNPINSSKAGATYGSRGIDLDRQNNCQWPVTGTKPGTEPESMIAYY